MHPVTNNLPCLCKSCHISHILIFDPKKLYKIFDLFKIAFCLLFCRQSDITNKKKKYSERLARRVVALFFALKAHVFKPNEVRK